ncbi:MAG: hypothetical protein ACYC1I_06145 [Acidimicrobiales bacterium]
MTLTIELIIVVVIVLIVTVGLLRYRKLRYYHLRGDAMKSTRPITPPPSPYATSKGFRLVQNVSDTTGDDKRAAPARPRLEPSREYVFGESQTPPYDVEALAQLRHDERWALSRSARRARFTPSFVRKLAVVVLLAFVLAIGAFYYFGHSNKGPNSSTTTTTTTKTGMAPAAPVKPYFSMGVISLRMNAST